jgi:hypothetical protein
MRGSVEERNYENIVELDCGLVVVKIMDTS